MKFKDKAFILSFLLVCIACFSCSTTSKISKNQINNLYDLIYHAQRKSKKATYYAFDAETLNRIRRQIVPDSMANAIFASDTIYVFSNYDIGDVQYTELLIGDSASIGFGYKNYNEVFQVPVSKQEAQVYINLSDTTKSRKKGELTPYDYEDLLRLKIYLVRGNYECDIKKFSYDPIIWFYSAQFQDSHSR